MDRIKLMSMIGTLLLENPKEADQVATALLKAHSPEEVDAALSLTLSQLASMLTIQDLMVLAMMTKETPPPAGTKTT